MPDKPTLPTYNHLPSHQAFLDDVLYGMSQPEKKLFPKYFYDERGSQLFEEICRLEEYYLTRTELSIMDEKIEEIVQCLGEHCLLIEYGSGSSIKTRLLLDRLKSPVGYVPIDISKEHLEQTAKKLRDHYLDLEVLPVCADFTSFFEIPKPDQPASQRVVYFPGSTIGNFDSVSAKGLLRQMAKLCAPRGGGLIGVDLKKEKSILEEAYNDKKGITQKFNLNLLVRINRELGADFKIDQFQHHAFFNEKESRIEMHLVSLDQQEVHIGEMTIGFNKNESIQTEYSYKYSLEDFNHLAADASFKVKKVWTDKENLFSVQYLTL